jgi:Uncharacterised conserved protein (DUF2228)
MSRSKEKHQAKLKEIYGVNFPDALFWLHEFIVEQLNHDDPIDLNDLGLYPCGVLNLLLNHDLDRVEFTADPVLHYRYYRDVPEFFTYLDGDCDGQHWGMLLDKPADGFRGVASYWSNDGAEMSVYDGVFDALLVQCEESIDRLTEYLLDEDTEDDGAENIAYNQKQLELYQKLKNRIEAFLEINRLPRHEFRSLGLETSSGLDVISNKNSGYQRREAIEMLKLGKNLWYSDGEDRSDEAFDLMKRADELLTENGLITACNSLFNDLIVECDHLIERPTDFLPYLHNADDISSYQNQIDLSQKLKVRIKNFWGVDNESGMLRLENNPGIEIASADNFKRDLDEAIEMLKLGRELWYWNGKDRSTEAYDLMRKAYELLERPELIRILEIHYCDRDRPSVDSIQLRLPLSS